MKLVAGHKYIRNGSGSEIVPYTEQMAKTLKLNDEHCTWVEFIANEDFVNDMQLEENKKIVARKAIPKMASTQVDKQAEVEKQAADAATLAARVAAKQLPSLKPAIKPVIAKPAIKPVAVQSKQVFEHMDIRKDMESDLAALE